jgi:hypothetical protein
MAAPQKMDGTEAFRLARAALSEVHAMELAVVAGVSCMVPTERHLNGMAKRSEDQWACDAYNWLAGTHQAR